MKFFLRSASDNESEVVSRKSEVVHGKSFFRNETAISKTLDKMIVLTREQT